jgi:hypothetical protein
MFRVTEDKIRKVAIENHLTTVEDITNLQGWRRMRHLRPCHRGDRQDLWSSAAMQEMPHVPKRMTNLQKIAHPGGSGTRNTATAAGGWR